MARKMTWIVVADAARARFFRLELPGRKLKPVWEHEFVGVNAASRALASDRPGRTFDSTGAHRHAKEPPTDPARYEKLSFARDLARKLDEERKRQAFDDVVIVAPPQFLGDFRAAMSGPLRDRVAAEINKDLSKLKPAELAGQLKEVLRPRVA